MLALWLLEINEYISLKKLQRTLFAPSSTNAHNLAQSWQDNLKKSCAKGGNEISGEAARNKSFHMVATQGTRKSIKVMQPLEAIICMMITKTHFHILHLLVMSRKQVS